MNYINLKCNYKILNERFWILNVTFKFVSKILIIKNYNFEKNF